MKTWSTTWGSLFEWVRKTLAADHKYEYNTHWQGEKNEREVKYRIDIALGIISNNHIWNSDCALFILRYKVIHSHKSTAENQIGNVYPQVHFLLVQSHSTWYLSIPVRTNSKNMTLDSYLSTRESETNLNICIRNLILPSFTHLSIHPFIYLSLLRQEMAEYGSKLGTPIIGLFGFILK